MWTTRSSSAPSTHPELLVRLELTVGFPSDVLARYYPNGKLGGLTLDGPVPGSVGQLVTLTVHVERPLRDFEVRGQLAWARHRASVNLKACFGVDFVGDHERLLQFARAELDPSALRLGPRLATDLRVRITHGGVTRREFLVDLSDGGAFVRSPDPIAVGQEIELHVKPPRAFLGFTLKCRVAWQRNTGSAPGFGVEFLDESLNTRPKLEKLLLKLAES